MKTLTLIMAMCCGVLAANAQNAADSITAYPFPLDSIDEQHLSEAVVRGHLPHTRMKGDAIVTKITGSALEKVGTAHDMLRHVPGIIRKGDDLEVIGRGTPIYFINGRQVRDLDELKRLQSDEVASVEVITNPGALYDATVTAVVRIRIVRRQGDGFGFNLFAKDEQSLRTDRNDPEAQLDMNYRYRDFDVFASVKEWQYRTGQWSDLGQITTDAAGEKELFRYDGNMENLWRGVGTHLSGGFNWQINERHSFGAKADYAVTTRSDMHEWMYMERRESGVLKETVISDGATWGLNPNNVLVNAYYNGQVGKMNIDFNTDMFFSDDNSRQQLAEDASTTDRDVTSLKKASNNMVATKLVLSYPIWKGQLMLGTEETFVRRDNLNASTGTGLPDSQSKVKDDTYAAFVQYAFSIGQRTNISAGLRYEHAAFDYNEIFNAAENLNRCYDNFFPSFSASTVVGKVNLSLSYASRTKRPSFWELNNSLSYHNRYVVQQGNAKLKPSTEHTVGLNAMYKFLTIGANYSHYTDLVCSWSTPMDDNGMVLVSYRNLDKPQHQLNVFAAAGRTWGCYSPTWTVAVVKQWLTLDFDNGSRSFDKPLWVFNANNAFRFKHGWQIEANSEFHSKAHYSNVRLARHYWAMETALQKSFLKNDALTLRLSWQDMFRKLRNDVYIYYGSYSIYQTFAQDYNRLVFTLRYNFNTARSKYKGSGAGQDARNRIGSTAR